MDGGAARRESPREEEEEGEEEGCRCSAGLASLEQAAIAVWRRLLPNADFLVHSREREGFVLGFELLLRLPPAGSCLPPSAVDQLPSSFQLTPAAHRHRLASPPVPLAQKIPNKPFPRRRQSKVTLLFKRQPGWNILWAS